MIFVINGILPNNQNKCSLIFDDSGCTIYSVDGVKFYKRDGIYYRDSTLYLTHDLMGPYLDKFTSIRYKGKSCIESNGWILQTSYRQLINFLKNYLNIENINLT